MEITLRFLRYVSISHAVYISILFTFNSLCVLTPNTLTKIRLIMLYSSFWGVWVLYADIELKNAPTQREQKWPDLKQILEALSAQAFTGNTVVWSLPSHGSPSSFRDRSVSLSHIFYWPPFGSLPSTACFSARTHPLPVNILAIDQTFSRINTPTISFRLFFLLTPPMKIEAIECSETSAYKIPRSGNHPKERIQHSEYGESLKSWIRLITFQKEYGRRCEKELKRSRKLYQHDYRLHKHKLPTNSRPTKTSIFPPKWR